jgi:hypothetical protein
MLWVAVPTTTPFIGYSQLSLQDSITGVPLLEPLAPHRAALQAKSVAVGALPHYENS